MKLTTAKRLAQITKRNDRPVEPYYMGDSARHIGKALYDNPFAPGTTNYREWAQGWREAKPFMEEI